jgi:LmbE family N-acetylglucosaminyl deacetylase
VEPLRVLGVGAHPDDIEFYCGGLLTKYAARGDQTFAAICTDGAAGHMILPPRELAALREQEARAGAKVYGAELWWMGEQDGELWGSDTVQAKMAAVFAWARPDVVITHPLEDYHPDHRACSELVTAACGRRRSLLGDGPALLYTETAALLDFVPEVYIDITGVMEVKSTALACHRSQVEWIMAHDHVDLLAQMRSACRTRGQQCGVPYAEGYRMAWPVNADSAALLP